MRRRSKFSFLHRNASKSNRIQIRYDASDAGSDVASEEDDDEEDAEGTTPLHDLYRRVID